MVRPLLADPPGWHHITGAGALHLAARFCTAFCTMQSASLLHSADTTIRLHRTFHLDGPEQHESRQLPTDAVPFWHLVFLGHGTWFVLLGSSATHCTPENPVSGADRVLHGSLAAHSNAYQHKHLADLFLSFVLSALPRAPPASPPAIHAVQ
ncbi:hypothetical protein HDV62DRAFT_323620 [Trichoderma sp. SZMC 28011]